MADRSEQCKWSVYYSLKLEQNAIFHHVYYDGDDTITLLNFADTIADIKCSFSLYYSLPIPPE